MPATYVLQRASKELGFHDKQEVVAALTKGEQQGLVTIGPSNVTLTDAGYAHATNRAAAPGQREDDVLKAVLEDVVSDGNGPGKPMAAKYVLMRASKELGFHDVQEVLAALTKGAQLGFLTMDSNSVTLTAAGYAHATS